MFKEQQQSPFHPHYYHYPTARCTVPHLLSHMHFPSPRLSTECDVVWSQICPPGHLRTWVWYNAASSADISLFLVTRVLKAFPVRELMTEDDSINVEMDPEDEFRVRESITTDHNMQ